MKKSDFERVVEIVRANKMKKLHVVHLLHTLMRAVTYTDLTTGELWKYFKERTDAT